MEFCDKNCEFKKIFKNQEKYVKYITFALTQCSLCTHSEKKDLFMPWEEVVEPASIIDKLLHAFKEHCIRGSG